MRHVARSGRGALDRYRALAPHVARGSRVLDAGAGGGEVVYVLRKFGFDASGLEPDEQYARHAREALGVPVATGFVQDAEFPAGSFDAVTMYHALEHVEDPSAILSRLRGWIAERGVLFIEVPNVEAVCIAPAHRFHFAHFYNFNRDALEALGRKAGFEPVETYDLAGRRQPHRRVQSRRACAAAAIRRRDLRARVGRRTRAHGAEILLFGVSLRGPCEPAAQHISPIAAPPTGARRPGRFWIS